jgi:hypothetical protein
MPHTTPIARPAAMFVPYEKYYKLFCGMILLVRPNKIYPMVPVLYTEKIARIF